MHRSLWRPLAALLAALVLAGCYAPYPAGYAAPGDGGYYRDGPQYLDPYHGGPAYVPLPHAQFEYHYYREDHRRGYGDRRHRGRVHHPRPDHARPHHRRHDGAQGERKRRAAERYRQRKKARAAVQRKPDIRAHRGSSRKDGTARAEHRRGRKHTGHRSPRRGAEPAPDRKRRTNYSRAGQRDTPDMSEVNRNDDRRGRHWRDQSQRK